MHENAVQREKSTTGVRMETETSNSLSSSVFRPSATSCRIGLMESRLRRCHRCRGGPPPPLADAPWLATPPKLHITMRAALWSHV